MIPFVARHPALFHVTRRSAVDAIRRDGLRSAASLTAGLADEAVLGRNRDRWTEYAGADGAPVWLRWQRLPDAPLARRLPPGMQPAAWRGFINGMAFLFPSRAEAEGLRQVAVDAGIDQAILAYPTAALLEAGCALLVCRWNNGYLDRSRPPRIRAFADYRPVAAWRRGDGIREVTVAGGIPAGVGFELIA